MMGDRSKKNLKDLFALLLPSLAAYITWEYQVIDATPGPPVKLDLLPTGTNNPFGPLSQLTMWPGPDGGVAVPTPGKLVRVRFTNGDQTKPEVCGLDPTDTPSIVYQYGLIVQIGDVSATPLAKAPWAIALDVALAAFCTAAGSATTAAQIATAATALGTAIGLLPLPSTTKVFGT